MREEPHILRYRVTPGGGVNPPDLRATAELIFPPGLADLLAPVITGHLPSEPIHIP